jgi:glycosyltransferase involved in cell wall biosynthesis
MKRLAIVIPAYKATFLPAALDSIAAQTCKDFTLYVGDDCSPEPIGDIARQYRDKIELVYLRFDSNLGGKDLVAQWERCIAMSQEEPYIWLFSDDDVMEPNCVELLLRTIDETKDAYDVYHFNSYRIDENGKFELLRKPYPSVLSSYDFYKGKILGRYDSFVVENVFSRRKYELSGGFKSFDLAWGSDVATWCIFSNDKGMCSIPEALIGWRRSSQNITPNKSLQISERKLMAECNFMAWAYAFFKKKSDILPVNEALFISKMMQYRKRVGWKCYQTAFATFFRVHGHHKNKLPLWLFLNLMPIKLYHLLKKNK